SGCGKPHVYGPMFKFPVPVDPPVIHFSPEVLIVTLSSTFFFGLGISSLLSSSVNRWRVFGASHLFHDHLDEPQARLSSPLPCRLHRFDEQRRRFLHASPLTLHEEA